MNLQKLSIKGEKGQTVCYTINNFRFDPAENKLKWDAFRFFTPEGPQIDEEGVKYFYVAADEVALERDNLLNKVILVKATRDNGTEVLEILEGAEMETVTIGLEGDIIISAFIPANTRQEIAVNYKEVTNG